MWGVVHGVTMWMLKRYVTSVEGRGSTKTLGKQWFRLSGRRFVNPGFGGCCGAVKSWEIGKCMQMSKLEIRKLHET